MKPTPPGWPRISTSLYYDDPARAIDWLCEAFGFEVKLKVVGENGAIEHSELTFGEGLVMVGGASDAKREKFPYRRSPTQAGGVNTQNLMVYVDDVEAHFQGGGGDDRVRAEDGRLRRRVLGRSRVRMHGPRWPPLVVLRAAPHALTWAPWSSSGGSEKLQEPSFLLRFGIQS